MNFEQKAFRNPNILFWKELLCFSTQGRRVDMITMTSPAGKIP